LLVRRGHIDEIEDDVRIRQGRRKRRRKRRKRANE